MSKGHGQYYVCENHSQDGDTAQPDSIEYFIFLQRYYFLVMTQTGRLTPLNVIQTKI